MKSDWTEIPDQAAADRLLTLFGHFHDSLLRECKYCSGTFIDLQRTLHLGRKPFLRCLFQRQWANPLAVELVFGELRELQLKPDPDNGIELASIQVELDQIKWSDDCGGLIHSRTLHWRVVDDWIGIRERFTAVCETDLEYYTAEPDEDERLHYVRFRGKKIKAAGGT
jgi:hypothetical protein